MGSLPAPDFAAFIARLAQELTARRLPFMLIGGQAVLLHGRPRLTEDIDVTLGVDPSGLPLVREVCRALQLEPLPDEVEKFVRETFVLPARHAETAIRVDFVFSTTPYERQAIERAVKVPVAGIPVPFATAEDLIIHKLFAGRAQDWEDTLSVVRRKGHELDWGYLDRWARDFAGVAGREELPQRLEALREEVRKKR
ncbi:MAG: nucleotidyl transferase AbiEii/AbiGii toxin family protein [Gemmatimonadetes bacterium]|nr:nucleotidyl transferase AbiEii/AbiGii toxin family protein [Gemmatimonadota bacterium]